MNVDGGGDGRSWCFGVGLEGDQMRCIPTLDLWLEGLSISMAFGIGLWVRERVF